MQSSVLNSVMESEQNPAGDGEDGALAFGHEHYVGALHDRLSKHFASPDESLEDTLVVGLYGEWGCGKTAWLKRLESKFEAEPEAQLESGEHAITVPVFFNAWRFEKEEHLIVPLLKTAQERLGQFGQRKEFKEWLAGRAAALGHAVVAVARGLKGKLSVPKVLELEWDVGASTRAAQEAARKSQEAERDAIDEYGSL